MLCSLLSNQCSYSYYSQAVSLKDSKYVKQVQVFDEENGSLFFKLCGSIGKNELKYEPYSQNESRLYKCDDKQKKCFAFLNYKIPEILSLSQRNILLTGMFETEDNSTVTITSKIEFQIYSLISPPMPKKGPTPTPSYQQEIDSFIYAQNITHYVNFDLSKFENSSFEGPIDFVIDQRYGKLFYSYSPWELKQCPKGFTCGGSSLSNMWVCWFDYDAGKYCHQIGDKRISLTSAELEEGYRLHYGGAYNIQIELRIECDHSLPSVPAFSFKNTYSSYNRAMTGPEISFNITSSTVCPIKFDAPKMHTPGPTPLPTPDANYKPRLVFEDKNKEGYIHFDLRKIPNAFPAIALKHNNTYQRPYIFVTMNNQTRCPTSYQSPGMNVSNLWKCFSGEAFGSNKCFMIGDWRYGVDMILTKDDEVKALFKGGVDDFSVEITFSCMNWDDSTIDDEYEVYYDELGVEEDNQNIIKFKARTKSVCRHPYEQKPIDSKGFISCIALATLYCVFTLYFFIGILYNFCKERTGRFPNSEFWFKFLFYAKEGTLSICRKEESDANSINQSYESLN